MKKIVEDLIASCVSNKSFVDVGPLWETTNEKISIAHNSGASSITAIDKFPFSESLWIDFKNHLQSKNIHKCEFLSMNILEYQNKPFDIVHCGGVIYHAPDPITLIKKLRSITKEKLIITSTVTPEIISNEFGQFVLPEGSFVFVPALSSQNKRILSKHWSQFLRGRTDGGLIHDCIWKVDNYNHWWWLFTPKVLSEMYKSCGFEIESTFIKDDLCTMSLV